MDHTKSYLRKLKQLLLALQDEELQHKGASLDGSLEQASQQLQLHCGPSVLQNASQTDQVPPITLKRLPGRGIGVVATRPIPAGRIILQEQATLTVPEPTNKTITPAFIISLVAHYVRLPAEIRQQVLDLHAYTRPAQEQTIHDLLAADSSECQLTEPQVDFVLHLHSIFATNSFEKSTPLNTSLYLEASRFNHSCLPNCDYEHTSTKDSLTTITVCSSRDIQPDEEITLPYLSIYLPRDSRQNATKYIWGFVCNCPACDLADPTVDTSVHEKRLAEYLQLKEDPYLTVHLTASARALPLTDLNEALGKSVRRGQIAGELGDNYIVLREHLLSAGICKHKWLLTGGREHLKDQIRFLELGQPIARRIPPSRSGQRMEDNLEKSLRAAKALNSIL